MRRHYQIFISYRRDGGEALAQLLYDRLTKLGYCVFLDVESLRSGRFNQAIYNRIAECTDFLLVLPEHALERCTDSEDWLRLEIEYALSHNKNIIPMMMRNFVFPDTLPDSLAELPNYQGIFADMALFDGVLQKLESSLLKSSKRVKSAKVNNKKSASGKLLLVVYAVVVALIATMIIVYEQKNEMMVESNYNNAISLQQSGRYVEALEAFGLAEDFKDTAIQIKETKYRQAKEMIAAGKYMEAVAILNGLQGYKDVETLLTTDDNLRREMETTRWRVGHYVTFGHYEQDASIENGKEDIEWLVLDVNGDMALLLSRYCLDALQFQREYIDVVWEDSIPREWLNSNFLDLAFTDDERSAILVTNVDNSSDNSFGGNNTQDMVFLLSYSEVRKYLTGYDEIIGIPTDFALGKGAHKSSSHYLDGLATTTWWLRSPGSDLKRPACITEDGRLSHTNELAACSIRPALWMRINNNDK